MATSSLPETTEAPVTSTIGQTTAPAPVEPVTRLDVCAPHLASDTLYAFKLYNPGSNHAVAAAFRAPAAIRFLDAGGGELHRIETSGPLATRRTAGNHGWIGAGDGNGTYAVYDEAPTPTYWGVLATEASVDGWVTIQSFDPSTGAWTGVPGCSN